MGRHKYTDEDYENLFVMAVASMSVSRFMHDKPGLVRDNVQEMFTKYLLSNPAEAFYLAQGREFEAPSKKLPLELEQRVRELREQIASCEKELLDIKNIDKPKTVSQILTEMAERYETMYPDKAIRALNELSDKT